MVCESASFVLWPNILNEILESRVSVIVKRLLHSKTV